MVKRKYLAKWIDEQQFAYRCPYCKKTHKHGNESNYKKNRTENRNSHCEIVKGNIDIVINSKTRRDLNPRAMKLYYDYLFKCKIKEFYKEQQEALNKTVKDLENKAIDNMYIHFEKLITDKLKDT